MQQRRELQFVQQGAEKVRLQAAADLRKLREGQEKAVQRAVRLAEERAAEELARQRADFERQLAELRGRLKRAGLDDATGLLGRTTEESGPPGPGEAPAT